jgi:hypothetical protein
MAASSTSSDGALPMSTILHMLTIKLSSSNYLLWKNQVVPLLSYQKLLACFDIYSLAPLSMLTIDGKEAPNPLYSLWIDAD